MSPANYKRERIAIIPHYFVVSTMWYQAHAHWLCIIVLWLYSPVRVFVDLLLTMHVYFFPVHIANSFIFNHCAIYSYGKNCIEILLPKVCFYLRIRD